MFLLHECHRNRNPDALAPLCEENNNRLQGFCQILHFLISGFRVVAAYPYGSKTIQSSYERIPGYIEKVKANGVEITSSIADLLEKVDCVLLETNDGRLHLEQAVEVFKSGKICYIDKPVGATFEV